MVGIGVARRRAAGARAQPRRAVAAVRSLGARSGRADRRRRAARDRRARRRLPPRPPRHARRSDARAEIRVDDDERVVQKSATARKRCTSCYDPSCGSRSSERRRRRLFRRTARRGGRGRHLSRARRPPRGDARARPSHHQPEGRSPSAARHARKAIPPRSARSTSCSSRSSSTTPTSALALLPPLVGPHTIVVGFQNGVETRRVADPRRRRGAHRRRRLLRVGGDRGAGRHQAHRDGPSDLRHARRIALAAARGAARGVPARRLSVDAEPGHHRRDLDQVRAALGVQRHDRGDARPDRRRS